MSKTALEKPNGAMVCGFVKKALLSGANETEIAKVLNKWMEGALEVPFTAEDLEEEMKKFETRADKDEVACLACLAACCGWLGCNGLCQAACYALACK